MIDQLLNMYEAGAVDGVTGMTGVKAGFTFGDLVDVDDQLQMVVCASTEIDDDGAYTVLCIADCEGDLTEIVLGDYTPTIYGHVTERLK